ncbi:hypothetical protein ACFLTQ_02190 [Chloroflexota bacterium]
MPGMIFHMTVYARTGGKPVMAVLNDAAGITGCLRWEQTHDREIFRRFSAYLLERGAEDIYRGMGNHLRVDEAMHGPESPVYPAMLGAEKKLRGEEALHTTGENYARMAELVVETGLDGVIKERNGDLLDMVEQSKGELDLDRISRLFAGFYRIDERKLREGLNFLQEIDFRELVSIEGLARAWLNNYETAMMNLSELESPEIFWPWYDYLARCFTDSEKMKRLIKLEEEIKPGLRERYDLSINLDFHDSR